jgi:hypothetical protein
MLDKIDEQKRQLSYELIKVEVPGKVMRALSSKRVSGADDTLYEKNKLNRFYRTNQLEKDIYIEDTIRQFYTKLTYDEKSLLKYCRDDELLYNHFKRLLDVQLKLEPTYIKGRWYHLFHRLPKSFRKRILRLDGERIVEAFDIPGSDMHMLAKHLERSECHIKGDELLKFQACVLKDMRTVIGKSKATGKATDGAKKIMKIWLNMKPEQYSMIRKGTRMQGLDNLMRLHLHSVWKFVRSRADVWQICMNEEFKAMSVKMVNFLHSLGVKSMTCHDAIYMKRSDMKRFEPGYFKWLFRKLMDYRVIGYNTLMSI